MSTPCNNGRVAKDERDDEEEALSGLSRRIDRRFEVTLQAFESNVQLNNGIAASLVALTESINEHRREFAEQHREFAEHRGEFGQHRGEVADLLEEARAQRQALFRMLDRLDGGGGPAPAT